MQNPENLRIRDVKEAADFLGLSVSRLNRFRCEGDGPAFCKLGAGSRARVGYRLADLETWLAARVRRSTSDTGARA